jgi:serine/threonine protein kinase
MTTAVDQFLGKLRRTLSDYETRHGSPSGFYKVTAVNEPYIGQTLDRCHVLERVGQGAMSVVYKAKQDFTERIVAIKMLRAQLCCDPSNVKRFQREAKAIARLSHPNLLNVYGVGTTNSGQPYIIMDYIEGKSLAQLLERDGQIDWKRAAMIFIQVCDAMQHAHSNRIIHRDLKPDNIMLVDNPAGEDMVKVVDFGIVKITDDSQRFSQRLTQTGEVWGSPVYMSPEQCMGHELDHRSDIYALGTVLYECLTGKPVFEGKRITDIVMKQLNEKPKALSAVRPDLQIPAWFEQVAMKALEKESRNRFLSMEEMKRAIEKGMLSRKDTADAVLKPTAAPGGEVQRSAVASYTDPFMDKKIGGKYLVKSFIGEGGMSVVYKAVQDGINRAVAIKVLREELCDDEANVKRFQRESKAVSQLQHPNLVAIYDVGAMENGQPYMVMEFLEGKPLIDVLERDGKMTIERALPIFIQMCEVMFYAHNKGFIHRDLKPHNVILTRVGDKADFVKLVDFGIVAYDGTKQALSQKLTAAGEICGSPIYMSPEQVLDDRVDHRSDIYSFGVVMYECLTGRPPFGGKRITDVLQKHVNSPPPQFSELDPDNRIPPALEGIIFKALEKKQENRYNSMEELRQALVKVAGKTTAGKITDGVMKPGPGRPQVEVVHKSSGGPNIVMLLIAMLVGAAIAGGAVMLWLSSQRQEPAQPESKKTETSSPKAAASEDPTPPAAGSNKPQAEKMASATTAKPTAAAAKRSAPRKRETLSDVMEATESANLRPHKENNDYSY